MKAKVLTFTVLAALLLVDGTGAKKLRIIAAENEDNENQAQTTQTDKATQTGDKTEEKSLEKTSTNDDTKEVHKRGIFYNGGFGGLSAHHAHAHSAAAYWPKSYAAHYGYSAHLPSPTSAFAIASPSFASHAAPHAFLKYHGGGFHFKPAVTSFAAAPAFTSTLSGLPNFASTLSAAAAVPHTHAIPHAHAHIGSPVTAAATPFVLRPGGAVVSSYSVNYPQHHYQKPAIAVQTVQSVQPFQPPVVQHALPVQPVAHVTPVQHYQPVETIQHVPAIQHYQPVQPVQSVQPIQPVHHIQPVQPVQPVVQVQPAQPIQPVSDLHPFHHFFQTTYVEQPHQVAAVEPQTVPAGGFPAIPSFPSAPAFPAIPSFPTLPAIPSIPTIPSIPSIPNTPTVPAIAAAQPPNPVFPVAAQAPNPVFPVAFQPPRPQEPPNFFVGFPSHHPAVGVQFPSGVFPLPGSSAPDSGSAIASPQIPTAPPAPEQPAPEPELPALEPQPTQQPWRPVPSFYHPSSPTAATPSNLNRPSHTLLPPYGSSPAEGYLPPAPVTQHQLQASSNIFDNLSDAEIEHIFTQANLAAQEEQHHHHHQQHQYQQPRQHHHHHQQQEYQHHY